MDIPAEFGHEKLSVYRRGLDYVSWTYGVLAEVEQSVAVLDHWNRAADSVVEGIANGNSRRSKADRNRYFNEAIGSALECAACLDICFCKELITDDQIVAGKKMLYPIVCMAFGLLKAESDYISESGKAYDSANSESYFSHETLNAYKAALELVVWLHRILDRTEFQPLYVRRLDKGTTSLVLNIAEGNGRVNQLDHKRFIDIAHTCAMQVAACLDVLVARNQVDDQQIAEGKQILARVVPLLLGLRGYLDDSE